MSLSMGDDNSRVFRSLKLVKVVRMVRLLRLFRLLKMARFRLLTEEFMEVCVSTTWIGEVVFLAPS